MLKILVEIKNIDYYHLFIPFTLFTAIIVGFTCLQVEILRKAGLIQGGSTENAIVCRCDTHCYFNVYMDH